MTKDESIRLIGLAAQELHEAALKKDMFFIKNWIDYINESYQNLKEYESE